MTPPAELFLVCSIVKKTPIKGDSFLINLQRCGICGQNKPSNARRMIDTQLNFVWFPKEKKKTMLDKIRDLLLEFMTVQRHGAPQVTNELAQCSA